MAKVLLVEDDNNLREIYQARLMAEGYDIVAAQNGEEALVVAKQNKPDLIISDVMMPRISGFEMLDILRNTDGLKHTKVIMLTALGQAEDQTRADNLGADKYLVKSQVTLEDIVNSAKELLAADGAIPAPPAPADPAPATTPDPTPAAAAPAEPAVDAAVPASVAPQPGTAVVVPPAPANPTPPTVTAVPMSTPPAEATAPEAPAPAPAADAAPAPAPAIEQSVTDSAPQSLAAEEAALQAQIDGYVNAPAGSTPAADAASASNDQTMENAVEQLNATGTDAAAAPAPEPAAPAEPAAGAAAPSTPEPAPAGAPAPAAEAAESDQATVAGKKIIQPLSDPAAPKPDLNELLAKEEAKEQAAAAPAAGAAPEAPAGVPTPPASQQGPTLPDGVDHTSITL